VSGRLSVWPPLPLDVYFRRPLKGDLPFPLTETGCRLFARGRQALAHGVCTVGLRPGDEVLVPAYHHGSEIEALMGVGLLPRFYEATTTLEPDEQELDARLTANVRALHLTHYLGFPQDVDRWRRWCDERSLLLLEDAAQAWLATAAGAPVGSHGDVVIFCLYKTFGLPDGAALLVRHGIAAGGTESGLRAAKIAARNAAWLQARSGMAVALIDRLRRDTSNGDEKEFALGDPDLAPSSAVEFLLRRMPAEDAARKRRANYQLLLDDLEAHVAEPFAGLPSGASPFAFPIKTDEKPKVLGKLYEQGIDGLNFWSIPHPALPEKQYPRAAALRQHVVGLPVHQELTSRDVERIAGAVRGRRPSARVRSEAIATFDGLRDEWTAVSEQTSNIFSTWEWNSIWWRHFGRGKRLAARACSLGDGRLAAILPLYVSSERPFRTLRLIGHRQADHLGPICAPSDRVLGARALRAALNEEEADLFIGDNVSAGDGWSTLLRARVLSRTGSPVLRPNGMSWDEVLASRSHNFREQVRRRERKLEREHNLNFRLADDPSRIQDDLSVLFSLHAARWGDRSWFRGEAERFHREFAPRALERGWLRLWMLELDGRPAASWYGFRFGGTESYYQAGRDPAAERWSVGFVLLAHSIREALNDGVSEYRFLEGGEGYKYRFANHDSALETIALPGSPAGRTALAAARVLGGRRTFTALGRRVTG
jgi:perosamine synthetase